MTDRYLRIVLTVIAVELAWIGLKDVLPTPVAAQQAAAPTRVIIRGFESMPGVQQYVPVAIAGDIPSGNLRPHTSRVEPGMTPLRVDLSGGVNARIVEPVRIQTSPSQPLDVKSVQASGAPRPGL
jgi:hypothetical protein